MRGMNKSYLVLQLLLWCWFFCSSDLVILFTLTDHCTGRLRNTCEFAIISLSCLLELILWVSLITITIVICSLGRCFMDNSIKAKQKIFFFSFGAGGIVSTQMIVLTCCIIYLFLLVYRIIYSNQSSDYILQRTSYGVFNMAHKIWKGKEGEKREIEGGKKKEKLAKVWLILPIFGSFIPEGWAEKFSSPFAPLPTIFFGFAPPPFTSDSPGERTSNQADTINVELMWARE